LNFKKQLNRPYISKSGDLNKDVYGALGLAEVGNFREIQKVDKHNVMYVSSKPKLEED
jgi:hypothetical protein